MTWRTALAQSARQFFREDQLNSRRPAPRRTRSHSAKASGIAVALGWQRKPLIVHPVLPGVPVSVPAPCFARQATRNGGFMSAPPEILEPCRRQLGISNRMLDILVPEVGLQSPRIVALVGQREPAGMPQHVGVNLDAEFGLHASTLDKPGKACRSRTASRAQR